MACARPISARSLLCRFCGARQEKRVCVICGEVLPPAAVYCNECHSYQSRGRRFFSVSNTTIAWWTAFFAVISTIVSGGSYVLDRESSTQFEVTGASTGRIHARVWNTGQKPSRLVRYELSFDKDDLQVADEKFVLTPNTRPVEYSAEQAAEQTPEQLEKRIVVSHGDPKKIYLSATTLVNAICASPREQCIDETRKQLKGLTFKLHITVEESGHWWELLDPDPYSRSEPPVEVPGELIEEFFQGACCNVQRR